METSNGVESQNKLLKYCYLPRRKNITLSQVATIVVNNFLPDHRKRYIQLNYKQCSNCRAYDGRLVPSYLHDRPRSTIIHCLRRKAEGEKLPSNYVTCIDLCTGKFQVKGREEQNYTVSFGSPEEMPCCSCPDFTKHFLPCKHFFAIFFWHNQWTWNSLPSLYLSSPYMSIDWPAIHQYFAEKNQSDLSADIATVDTENLCVTMDDCNSDVIMEVTSGVADSAMEEPISTPDFDLQCSEVVHDIAGSHEQQDVVRFFIFME